MEEKVTLTITCATLIETLDTSLTNTELDSSEVTARKSGSGPARGEIGLGKLMSRLVSHCHTTDNPFDVKTAIHEDLAEHTSGNENDSSLLY